MIRYAHNLDTLVYRLKREFTFIPFFTALSLKDQQERYFFSTGVDGGKTLSAETILRRLKRRGYYKKQPRSGAVAGGPYGVWTGNTLAHTHEEKGKINIRVGHFTVGHGLQRSIQRYWDESAIDAGLSKALEIWFQRAFDLRPPLRRISA